MVLLCLLVCTFVFIHFSSQNFADDNGKVKAFHQQYQLIYPPKWSEMIIQDELKIDSYTSFSVIVAACDIPTQVFFLSEQVYLLCLGA